MIPKYKRLAQILHTTKISVFSSESRENAKNNILMFIDAVVDELDKINANIDTIESELRLKGISKISAKGPG